MQQTWSQTKEKIPKPARQYSCQEALNYEYKVNKCMIHYYFDMNNIIMTYLYNMYTSFVFLYKLKNMLLSISCTRFVLKYAYITSLYYPIVTFYASSITHFLYFIL